MLLTVLLVCLLILDAAHCVLGSLCGLFVHETCRLFVWQGRHVFPVS